MLILLAVKLSS